MDVLLVRHAKAEDREVFALTGAPDAERPLTKAGAKEMRKVAKALHGLVPQIDAFASSPLRRAVHTAEIMAARYGGKVQPLAQLAPGHDPARLLHWLHSQGDCQCVALVGHEPDLGLLASRLLGGGTRSFLPLKKGGCCLLRFPGAINGDKAELVWALPPALLRACAAQS